MKFAFATAILKIETLRIRRHFARVLQRVGHEVPGVVVWPLLLSEGWGGECSEILISYIELLYNPRVKIVFTSVGDEELCMCACHTNHSVGCIKERIKLSVGI